MRWVSGMWEILTSIIKWNVTLIVGRLEMENFDFSLWDGWSIFKIKGIHMLLTLLNLQFPILKAYSTITSIFYCIVLS